MPSAIAALLVGLLALLSVGCGAAGSPLPEAPRPLSPLSTATVGIPSEAAGLPLPGAPRPLSPLSTATVTSQKPTLTWVLAPGTDQGLAMFLRRGP